MRRKQRVKLVKWEDLSAETKKQVERTFVHWMYDLTTSSFLGWVKDKAFYVRKDGLLDNRYGYCESAKLVDVRKEEMGYDQKAAVRRRKEKVR